MLILCKKKINKFYILSHKVFINVKHLLLNKFKFGNFVINKTLSTSRLAVNNMHYVSNVLGIKDPIHKQKIALKAMDVVLFGPPRGMFRRLLNCFIEVLTLNFSPSNRDWHTLERLHFSYFTSKCNNWLLVCLSAK